MKRPVIGIPIGDPAGIGPELVLKALKNEKLYSLCKPLVIGSADVLKKIEQIIKTGLALNFIEEISEAKFEYGTVDIIDVSGIDTSDIDYGKVQAKAGKAAHEYIIKTVQLAAEKQVDAIATTPINKEAIKAGNVDFIGHTEMLAHLTGTNDPLTMFQVHNLRIFFLSRHVSLKKAIELANKDRIVQYLLKCDEALKQLGLKKRTIAVAGLNPHNGEHGLFGDEEMTDIEPAVLQARANGVDAVGPIPADSVFHLAMKGRYDAVLSLYHDQGHVAAKTLDFEKTISLTIGMPFLRTSVDHGTAFDIAGKGIASSVSMEEAIRLAAEYCF